MHKMKRLLQMVGVALMTLAFAFGTAHATPKKPTKKVVAVKKKATTPAPTSKYPVKMSENKICHAPGTTFYDKTKKYTPYNSLKECLAAGGREPER